MEDGLILALGAALYVVSVCGLVRCRRVGDRIDSTAHRIAHNAAMIRENAEQIALGASR